jgi:hypothetical protein
MFFRNNVACFLIYFLAKVKQEYGYPFYLGAGRSDAVSLLDYGYNQLSYVLTMLMPLAFFIDQIKKKVRF